MSTWIKILPVENANGSLKEAYDLAKTPAGTVDNVMRIHSQRPHTMVGHLKLYRSVLHHKENTLPLWFLEAVGVFTSLLNKCEYSFTHHCANMRRLLKDDERFGTIEKALREHAPEEAFSGKELALMRYTEKLTISPSKVEASDVESAKFEGATEGEILEVNQVCAYFCYSNRTINGLGVTLADDTVGYYKE
tara:strand:+ start:481 stop:1056 length:576 start_codon:yes stop_codon:yes gene_type:complete